MTCKDNSSNYIFLISTVFSPIDLKIKIKYNKLASRHNVPIIGKRGFTNDNLVSGAQRHP